MNFANVFGNSGYLFCDLVTKRREVGRESTYHKLCKDMGLNESSRADVIVAGCENICGIVGNYEAFRLCVFCSESGKKIAELQTLCLTRKMF